MSEFDDNDTVDEYQLFYNNFLPLVKTVSSADKSIGVGRTPNGTGNGVLKFVEYVKKAPTYGLESTMKSFRQDLLKIYTDNKADILEGYDDWVFKPKPVLISVSSKIYLPVGNIYQRCNEKDQTKIHAALMKVFTTLTSAEDEIAKLKTLASDANGGGNNNPLSGLGGFSNVLSGLLGSENNGFKSLLDEMVVKVSDFMGKPDNPGQIDTTKMAGFISELINDKSENSLISRIANDPAISKLSAGIGDVKLDANKK